MSNYKKYLSYHNIPLSGTLTRILDKEHVTQSELAARSGISRQRLNDYITGRKRLYKTTSLRLEKALKIGIPGFFTTVQKNHDTFMAKAATADINKPDLNKFRPAVFWDTRFDAIDWNRNRRWIIQRVFEYGNSEEIAETIRFYGEDGIRKTLSGISSKRLKARRDTNIKKHLK